MQGFFARLVEKQLLAGLREGRGRFRNDLLVCLKRYAAHERNKLSAQERGGRDAILPLEIQPRSWRNADRTYQLEPASPELTPDRIYQRRWAVAILDRAMNELETSWIEAGKEMQFSVPRLDLTGDSEAPSYATVAEQLGMSPGAVKTAVYRLRAQFREILCAAAGETLDRGELLEDELQQLFLALRA